MKKILFVVPAVLLLGALAAHAFLPPTDRNGPLTVAIADPGEVQALEKPIAVPVTLSNSSTQALTGKLRIAVTDDWRVEGAAVRDLVVPANGKVNVPVSVIAGRGTYAALYPVHAYADFKTADGKSATAHAILIASVAPAAVAAHKLPAYRQQHEAPARGALQLDKLNMFQITVATHGREPVAQSQGWRGHDEATGGSCSFTDANRGDLRRAINVHPPYRGGWGQMWADCQLKLPAGGPLMLEFATAIRDVDIKREPPSDGVQFEVHVKTTHGFTNLFTRFSKATQWETARVDLTAFAGRDVTLRFVTDPGPAHNTTCDSSFWSVPTLFCGPTPTVESDVAKQARRAQAVAAARTALAGDAADWAWKLESEAGSHGAAVVPGPFGISDAFIAISDGQRDLVFEGFTVQIDQLPFGPPQHTALCDQVRAKFRWGRRGVLEHDAFVLGKAVGVRTEVWAEKGALRFAFSMPDAQRDERGTPRFSLLGLGAASEQAKRVFAGFGNVIENPGRFDLHANGFQLSTRHVGLEFTSGLALVQACDVFPDLLTVNPEKRLYQFRTHHDATLSLLPSSRGAFAAARAYRAIAGFEPAAGVAKIQGKLCLDQWGGDYAEAARGLDRVARYGVTDAVFVKHVWQRWGYDYRLPDIYPPSGSQTDFMAMAEACQRNGILFAPHDNYIDFYPDADGYSYDHILFNSDGTPQKAWYNKGRDALSYRWLPNAFAPFLERNLKLVESNLLPTSYFVDVFSAIAPLDYYDRAGRFHTKTECAELWGACFDKIRKTFGNRAPMISEAGHDALIGHLDAGQSDHSGWLPAGETYFGWRLPAGDAERVPWHDMASHGSFVLLAGGLGSRYAGLEHGSSAYHGYASDDYLTTTVLGGRNPMCDGPFSRNAVMTYWLLHDLCAELAKRDMLAHEFGANIHQQRVTFSDGAQVVANRGADDWKTEGVVLPRYGFVARAGNVTADITRRDGQVSAMARNGKLLFVDARPLSPQDRAYVRVQGTKFEDLSGGRGRLQLAWEVLQPVPETYHLFIHFTDPTKKEHEGLLAQGTTKVPAAQWRAPGKFSSTVEFEMPAGAKLREGLGIRIGFFAPKQQGARLRMAGNTDHGSRVRCGAVRQATGGGALSWQPDPFDNETEELQGRQNMTGKLVDFGPVSTAGAFRLDATKAGVWVLTPLPNTLPFAVELKLDQFSATGAKVVRVMAVDETGKEIAMVTHAQNGDRVSFQTTDAFAYKISF
jgi:hypothetical protein